MPKALLLMLTFFPNLSVFFFFSEKLFRDIFLVNLIDLLMVSGGGGGGQRRRVYLLYPL